MRQVACGVDTAGNAACHLLPQSAGYASNVSEARMKLKVLLPYQVFAEIGDVLRIVAETPQGSFGLLPRRLDCVAELEPGILTYETKADGEVYVAVDAGILVKAGTDVLVSVRNAIGGTDLGKLRAAVAQEFVNLDENERQVRAVLARLESGFVRHFTEYHRA
ncbi:MAG TPA: F0F1 ATP synthase subunit epsilon [Gallionella sp.]|nr:F0F1 ATP synthase subunit epsilon [Gallionella sp.]